MTDDGAYLLIKASALREQAREMLVSTLRSRTSPLSQPVMALRIDCHMHQRASCRLVLSPPPLAWHILNIVIVIKPTLMISSPPGAVPSGSRLGVCDG